MLAPTITGGRSTGAGSEGPDRPRALHVCTRYLRGGSERRVADVIRALPDVDHLVVVGGDSDLERAQRELAPARIVGEPRLVRPISPMRDLRCLVALRKVMATGHYDVVYTHQSKAGTLGRVAARLGGGPPVVHSLSMANFGPGFGRVQGGLQRLVESRLTPWTGAWVVVGADLAERYRRLGADPARLHVVRSGAPLPDGSRSPARARARLAVRYGFDRRRPLILHLGSLDHRKNVMDLPDYLSGVLADSPDPPMLLVAGEGPLAEPLAAAFRRSGQAEDVRMTGYVSPVDDLLVAADVVVLLSGAEGLPQVLLQAAAVGTPFVAYPVDGVAELLSLGAIGRVVPHGDVPGAAMATAKLLAEGTPRVVAPEFASALDEWSPQTIRRRHRAVFERVAGSSSKRSSVPRQHTRTAPAGGLVVEFLGLPGAGKTSVARALAAAMPEVSLATHGLDAGTSTLPRMLHKALAVASEVLVRSPASMAAARHVASSGQGGPTAVLRRTTAWLVAQRLVARARRRHVIAVLDEGSLQAIWSTGLVGDHRHLLDAWSSSPDRWRRPDLVVVLRLGTDHAAERLAGRDDPHSRVEQARGADRTRLLQQGQAVLDDLVDGLRQGGLAYHGVLEVEASAEHTLADTVGVVRAMLDVSLGRA